MRDLDDILKMKPTSEKDIFYQLTVSYLLSQKNEDEYVLCDKTSVGWNREVSTVSEYSAFWYSHICGGGSYYHLLSIHVLPTPANVEIVPARNYGLNNRKFLLHDPKATELKAFIRQILDTLKKAQGRHPW